MCVQRAIARVSVLLVAFQFFVSAAVAQTTVCQGRLITVLDFRNPTLVSGTALAPGAVYRFSNVATGVDALVTIDAITNGSLNVFDRDTGLIENFQPELNNNNASSADFTISFVTAGGTTPVSLDFAASGIDIDGNNSALREYAEFSTPFAEFVLDSPTELDVNASGPSVPANFRFESRTSAVAPGIDPTATANIVSVQYLNTSSFSYRIGTLGSGVMTRLTSLDFNCPTLNFPTPTPQIDQDFGDAPVSPYGNPVHDIVSGIQLGASNTIETAPFDSPTAIGDTGDDGVTLPALTQGQSATISVSTQGAGGLLQAWIDWNGDGDFNDTGEQVASDLADNGAGDLSGATGAIQFSVTAPGSATTFLTFARFRWSTQSGVTSTMTASDGEVEDYSLSISPSTAPICPVGQAVISSTGNAIAVQTASSVANRNRALGPIASAGISPPDSVSAEMNRNSDAFTVDLGVGIPQNTLLRLSAARDGGNQGNNARLEILFSTDDVTYVSGGTYGTPTVTYPSAAQDVIEHNDIPVPVAGARYIRFDTLNNDDIFIDGVEYSQICTASTTLDAVKTVSVYDPASAGLFAVPGNDVVYTITVTNTGGSAADSDSIFIVDLLPTEVEFYNGDIDDTGPLSGPIEFVQSGAGLTFTDATDLRFSNGATAPASFAACAYSPVSGYDPAVRFVCFNPKGAMASGSPDPSFSVSFRARIQ